MLEQYMETSYMKKIGIRLFILVWIIVFINYTNYGYSMIVFIIPFLFFQNAFLKFFDLKAILLLLFFFVYTSMASFNVDYIKIDTVVRYLCFPVTAYISGRYIVNVVKSSNQLSLILFLFIESYSIIAILSVLLEIMKYGFIGNLYRDMPLIGRGDEPIAATLVAGLISLSLISLSVVFIAAKTKTQKWLKFLFFIFAVISIICVLRLGSRTGIALMGITVISVIIFDFKNYSQVKKIILISSVIILTLVIASFVMTNEELFTFYSSRGESDEYGSSTFGGRTQLWSYFISQMPNYLLGGIPQSLYLNSPYAHNIWLDIARVAGVLPLSLFLIFSIQTFRTLSRFIRTQSVDMFLKSIFIVLIIGMTSQFFVEPVIEGLFMLLVFFCMILGMIEELNNRKKSYNKK